jgi:hypothetical protein
MARGRDVTSVQRYEALQPRSQNAYSRVLDAVDLMAEHPDWSRTRAARVAHVDTRTIERYASGAFDREGRRVGLRPNDWLYRSETMPALVPAGDRTLRGGGVLDLEPRTRHQRSVLGSYWNDVQKVVADKGAVDLERKYGRERIAGHRLETGTNRIRERYAQFELDIVVEVSPRA